MTRTGDRVWVLGRIRIPLPGWMVKVDPLFWPTVRRLLGDWVGHWNCFSGRKLFSRGCSWRLVVVDGHGMGHVSTTRSASCAWWCWRVRRTAFAKHGQCSLARPWQAQPRRSGFDVVAGQCRRPKCWCGACLASLGAETCCHDKWNRSGQPQ